MAHHNQLMFIAIASRHLRENWAGAKILEIGAHDVNGSIRPFFDGSDYTGVDLSEGKGVDLVSSGHELRFPDASFDLTVSCECFEHNPEWGATFTNMCRMTKPGGIVMFTCASTGRLEHGTIRTTPKSSPGTQAIGWDYYKNLKKSDFKKFNLGSIFESFAFFCNDVSKDLCFIGKKHACDGYNSELTLNLLVLTNQLVGTNSIIREDVFSFKKKVKAIFWLPIRMAEFLPDKFYQDFVIFWLRFHSFLKKLF